MISSLFSYNQLGTFNNYIISIFNYDKAEFAGAVTGVYGMKERYKKDIFEHYIKVPFEDRNFYIIVDYDVYLEQHYKNYMKLPPKDKQINHQTTAWWLI